MTVNARYQPEIDGLRAVAIVPVVLFHAAVPGLRGGYVGVDVFFVISGFLITRLLLTERSETGRTDFWAFYARRVRRLLPALATVTVVVLALGALVLTAAGERQDLSMSALATVGFVANIYFWRTQAVYFAPKLEWLPLVNMWTLSVEEQFYLVWPALLVVAAALARYSGRRTIATIALAVTAVFVLSFAVFIWGAKTKLAATFFLAPTRGWEFALGAMLALFEKSLERWRTVAGAGAAAALGLAAIAAAVFGLFRSFELAVIAAAGGAAAVIVGVTAVRTSLAARLLRTAPFVAVGKLSYSWYLWHWPLLVLVRVYRVGDVGLALSLAVALGSLALAALTFALIENPIRLRRPWPFTLPRQTIAAGAALSCAVAALALAMQLHADAVMRRDPWLSAIDSARTSKAQSPPGCHVPQVFTALAPAQQCLIGAHDTPARLLLWGDSQALQLVDMVAEHATRSNYAAVPWTMSACAPLLPVKHGGLSLRASCAAFDAAVAGQIPSLAQAGLRGIVLASRGFGFAPAPAWIESWKRCLRATLARARALGLRVLVVAPIPEFGLPIPQCLGHGAPERCGAERAEMERRRAPLIDALRETIGEFDNARLWDPFPLLCGPQFCTAVHDGAILYSDRGHLSKAGARYLLPFAAPSLAWLTER